MQNNNNFDFDSKKYGILLFFICFVFFMLIIKAFDYLPDNNITTTEEKSITTNNLNYSTEVTTANSTDEAITKEENKENTLKKENNDNIKNKKNDIEFIEIEAPKGVNQESLTPINTDDNTSIKKSCTDESAAQTLFSAKKLKADGDYTNALVEFQKIQNMTSDKEILASAYQEIAELYAISRKYGTALNFASKSYNLSPSYEREILIAKIYYKTGDTHKAMNNVNNILQKGFN